MLGPDQAFRVAAVALHRSFDLVATEKVRIPAGKRARKRLAGVARPGAVPPSVQFIRFRRCHREDLDNDVVAPKTESRGVRRNAGSRPFEIVREDCAARRDRTSHDGDKGVDGTGASKAGSQQVSANTRRPFEIC